MLFMIKMIHRMNLVSIMTIQLIIDELQMILANLLSLVQNTFIHF